MDGISNEYKSSSHFSLYSTFSLVLELNNKPHRVYQSIMNCTFFLYVANTKLTLNKEPKIKVVQFQHFYCKCKAFRRSKRKELLLSSSDIFSSASTYFLVFVSYLWRGN